MTDTRLKYKPERTETFSDYSNPESKPFSTIDPTATLPVRFGPEGESARPAETVVTIFRQAVDRHGDQAALKVEGRDGADKDGWTTWTYQQFWDQSKSAAKAFAACGLEKFGTVAIIGFNSPEWHISNMGAILAGGKAAGIYTTNEADACKYIVEHSQASVVVCEDKKHLAKFLEIRNELPHLKKIIQWTGDVDPSVNETGSDVKVVSWKEFMALADQTSDEDIQARMDAQEPGQASTLIYTSGTTGPPKAVMISHDNCTWTAGTLNNLVAYDGMKQTLGDRGQGESIVSYLPLSHIAAQMLDIHLPLWSTAKQPNAFTVWFAKPSALKGTIVESLNACRPTVFFGVPRVWEKIGEKMKAVGAVTKGVKKKISTFAKHRGAIYARHTAVGGNGKKPFGWGLSSKIHDKIKIKLGLDNVFLYCSAAAPIHPDTVNYFSQLGINICQCYGMSECTGPMFAERPDYRSPGSCGIGIKGAEWKIDHVEGRDKKEEGEICYRGRHIMMGYMFNEVKTNDSIDPEGWLHSGDVGRVDADGLLRITGRIKEIIITAGGENIAPVPVEQYIKSLLPAVSNFTMIGDRKKFCSALVTLKQ